MSIVTLAALTVAAGSAEVSPHNWNDILTRRRSRDIALGAGKALAPCLGNIVNRQLISAIKDAESTIDLIPSRPIAHGWESIVYLGKVSDISSVLKLQIPKPHKREDRSLRGVMSRIAQYSEVFEGFVPETFGFDFVNPFAHSNRLVAVAQTYIEGEPIAEDFSNVNPVDGLEFAERIGRFLKKTDGMPDLCTPGNVIVNSAGRPVIVDLGNPIHSSNNYFGACMDMHQAMSGLFCE